MLAVGVGVSPVTYKKSELASLFVPQNVVAPFISGTAQDGQTLTLDDYGSFLGGVTSYAIRWLADGVAFGGTATTQLLGSSQVGKIITAGITATNSVGSSIEEPSNSLGPVAAAAGSAPSYNGSLLLAGTGREGYTATCIDDGWSDGTVTRNWRRDGVNISGATSQAYTFVSADVGHLVDCLSSSTNGVGTSNQASVTSIGPVLAAVAPSFSANPVISGAANVGVTFTVTNNGTYTADPAATLSYQWKRDGSTNIGTNSPNYASVLADNGHSISCTVTATNVGGSANATSNGIGPLTLVQPVLDPTVSSIVLSLDSGKTEYPPRLKLVIPPDFKSDTCLLWVEADDDIAFGSPLFNLNNIAISDTEAAQGYKIISNLNISSPAVTFFRASYLFTNGGIQYYAPWSNIQGHGDATAPTLTSGTSFSSNERSPVLQTLTFSEACYVTLAGADAASIEFATALPASSVDFRLTGNAVPDYETQSSYTFTVTPSDASGNVGSTSTITLSITDIDELATAFTFTDVNNASQNTDYTSNTITVAGLATGVSVPIVLTGSGTYQKNGGSFGTASGTVVNTDTFAVKVHSASASATGVSATITLGDVAANQVSDTYTVTTTNTFDPTTLIGSEFAWFFDPSDLSTLFQSNAGSTAVASAGDVVGYLGDKSGKGNHFKSSANDSTRPTYQTTGGAHLLFDGSDDKLQLTVAGLMAAGAATICIAVKNESTSQTNKQLIAEGSSNGTAVWNPYGRVATSTSQQAIANISNDSSSSQLSNQPSYGYYNSNWNVLLIEDTGSNIKITQYAAGTSTTNNANYTRSGTYANLNRTGLGATVSNSTSRWFNCSVGRGFAIGRALTGSYGSSGTEKDNIVSTRRQALSPVDQ